ncbi:TIM-barrel domain-containing protein [Melioribacter sp. Ez-97]|uniref:TIM-barrel domain-containing protein n=1 Tax=Melioribacter sp. Ez-97 TaxID=3423434 RepID=UPI003ED8CDD7
MKRSTLILLLFLTSALYPQTNNGVQIKAGDIYVKAVFYSENIVRVLKWHESGSENKLSLSVIFKNIPTLEIKKTSDADGTIISSSKLKIVISHKDGSVIFKDPSDNILLKETGKAEFIPEVYHNDSGFTIKQNFEFSKDEGIYGLGQHQYGYFNYRGKKAVLVQSNTDAVNPFLISTNGYGILWDNYSKTIFDDTRNTPYLWSGMGDNIDYYFITGENMDKIIAGYRLLTGKAPLYGKWAYGYWQSKEHYDTQAELMGVAKKYRKLGIPIDNIIQDWDYWNGAANWSGMFFDKTLFPSPKEMCDSLHNMNYHIIISIWPALGPNTEIYADMAKHGFLYRPVGWAGFKYYDAFNPAANDLYWKYLKAGLYSKGLDGWWIDSTEPDVVNAMTKESSEYELKKMGGNYLGSWARYLNAFSLAMTSDIHKYWRRETSDRRAYILTRSTYAGQQRNAATTWSGDIGASWDVYKRQIAAGLNHSMSGIPYWTFDIGAFVLGAYEGVFMNGGKDPAYQELYTRMFQLGTFTPIFRSHGSETPREIWEFGEFTPVLIKFDNLRYRLLPYIYSLAWQVTNNDYTIMRGLPMDFQNDKSTYNIDDQFIFGPSMMICPVTEAMYYRPPEKSVPIKKDHFRTIDGKAGLNAQYFKDPDFKNLSKEKIDTTIDFIWYTGRPDYVTDSAYSVRWRGKLIPDESGKHQFHLISYDRKRVILNGDTLKMVYTSVEQYTEPVELTAGKEYDLIVEVQNNSTGAAKMRLFWKTPSAFAKEDSKIATSKERKVYLPKGAVWFDFWNGKKYEGGAARLFESPIDKIPILIKAGSIIPMGPFVQYSSEKPADPLEIRIYPGADGAFTLYEDEGDNYNYEKGIYSTIDFRWNDKTKTLTIGKRNGEFPGMLKERAFNIAIVKENHGTGIDITAAPDKSVTYKGDEITLQF